MKEILYIVLGLSAGVLSGMFGIGGGTILIPGLVLLAGLSQHEAQGTTLAIMLLPIGLFAVMKYYNSGHVHFHIAIFICLGFLIGGLLGANIAEGLSGLVMKKAFGVFLMIIAIYTIVSK
ncbi:MAG: sulfite exporter TauE/SafE family protein [Candidatus Omnitrophota bacterium]|jgi:hypothetical protein